MFLTDLSLTTVMTLRLDFAAKRASSKRIITVSVS